MVLLSLATAASSQTISDFNPKFGAPGDKIIVDGSGFLATTAVRFGNGTSSVAVRGAGSNLQIPDVVVPANASTGFISVSNPSQPVVLSVAHFTRIGSGPHITGFSPAFGAVGSTIQIYGVHFTNPIVRFGGVLAPGATATQDGYQITVNVPAGALSGAISVQTTTGTSNSASAFTVIGPGPYVSDFSPAGGVAGATVTVNGELFNNPLSVRFGSSTPVVLNAPQFYQFTINVPASATTGPITVSNSLGGSASAQNFFLPPSPTSFAPFTGRAGTNVVIRGTSLLGITNVAFNGVPASFTINASTQITATVSAGTMTGTILLQNPVHSFFTTSNFVVQPTVVGFTPGFGPPPTSVAISGLNLLGSTAVQFGGVNAATVVDTNQSQIFAHVPAAAVTGPVTVTTTNGSSASATSFFIPARVTTFAPSNGPPGTVVMLTGENFLGATAVAFAGTPASFTAPSNNTTLYAVVPAGIVTGPITVTTPAGSTNSAKLFYGPPLVSGFNPTSGLPGTNVLVTGTNFLNVTAVNFNGLPASFAVSNLSALYASVPVGSATGPISVVNNAGTGVSAADFVLNYIANLGLTLVSSPQVGTVGSNLTYTLTVTNAGPFTAQNLRVTNNLPTAATLVSAGTTLPGALTTAPTRVTLNAGNVASGISGTVTIVVTPTAVGWVTNTASVRSDTTDSAPADNDRALGTYIEPVATLHIQLPSPASVRVSWPVELTNHVLQYSTNLTPPGAWSNIVSSPQIVGNQRVVDEPPTNSAKFFRLKR
jgi:uncharacterized repeat protein (TIGR01451 family)